MPSGVTFLRRITDCPPAALSPAKAACFTRDRAMRVARRLQAGQIEINGGAFNPIAPFGGYKQSGHGRENGRYAIEELLQVKSLQL